MRHLIPAFSVVVGSVGLKGLGVMLIGLIVGIVTTNDLSKLIQPVLAKSLEALQKATVYTRYFTGNMDIRTPVRKGTELIVGMTNRPSVSDVTPGPVSGQPADNTPDTVSVKLDRWKKVNFSLTEDEKQALADNSLYVPSQLSQAVAEMAEYVNNDCALLYKGVPNMVGTPGATPFTSDEQAAIDAQLQLNLQRTPVAGRAFIMNVYAQAKALKLAGFQYAANSSDPNVQREGALGRRFGFDMDWSDMVPTHTAGTASAKTVTLISDSAAGDKTITLKVSSGTGTVVVGDVITIDGDSQKYVVTANATLDTSGVPVSILGYRAVDGLAQAVDGSVTPVDVDVAATHVANLAFHPDAFVLVARPVLPQSMPAGTLFDWLPDPKSGLILRYDIIPGYHEEIHELSLLWGVKCVRPEFATRVAG